MSKTKILLPLFLSLLTSFFTAKSQVQIKGVVVDAATNEPLTGATVNIKQVNKSIISGLDGTYFLANVPKGQYKISCNYIGYHLKDTLVMVDKDLKLDFLMNSLTNQLQTVAISCKVNKETDHYARKAELTANNVINVISARTIQLSPDITVANVLQRASGVSVERSSSGEARYAIIRGMDQRYNYTLVNGIKIPSPDNKNRYVPMDIFPADLVERLEVSKSLTPDMEGDAVGGVVNMVMKNAPDRLYLNASLSTGYSQNLFNSGYDYFPVSAINRKSPYQSNGSSYLAKPEDFTRDNLNFTKKNFTPNTIASLAIGNRFFNNRLGVMLGVSYQNIYKAYSGIFNPSEYGDETDSEGVLLIKHANARTYSNQLTRTGINAKLDYNINDKNRLSFYGFYSILDDAQTRLTTDSLQVKPKMSNETGQVWYFGRSRFQRQTINNYTLQGNHEITPNLAFNWTGAYSRATSNVPDLAEYEYDTGFYADGIDPKPYQHPNVLTDYHRIWENNTDKDLAGYGNLAYTNKVWNIPFTITVGGMYRAKNRKNDFQDYLLRSNRNPDGSIQEWKDIYQFSWSVFNPNGSPENANTYNADEDVSAQFAMLKFNVNKLEATLGMRFESTSVRFNTLAPVTSEGKSGSVKYSDQLPSINLRYLLTPKTNLRFSYFASINRPGYFEIIPTFKNGDDYTEIGNPYLKHATANNLDFRYEFFPKATEQILLGVFYKNINNPIEYGFVGGKANQYQPNNFGEATNYGVEAVYEKYLNKFGVRVNYTYTKSEITTTKIKTFDKQRIEPAPSETRPLQGQSDHIANVALLYKDVNKGIDIQLAWQYTGKRIALVSPYYGFDQWQKPLSTFDFSGEKRFAKHYAVFVKVQNLLNTADEYYVKKEVSNQFPVPNVTPGSANTLTRKNLYGQNYQLGLRYIL